MAILSNNDKLVLGALFDAESSPANTASIITQPSSPSLPGIPAPLLTKLQALESTAILPLNSASPPTSSIQTAVADLTTLITSHPTYASAYNNRAQALRLLHGDDLTNPSATSSTLYQDLCSAIQLAGPTTSTSPSSNPASVSSLQASILAAAHTQRGHLLNLACKTIRNSPEKSHLLTSELKETDAETLERMAGRDFTLGGRYGNTVARQMAVQMNPYAKMCGEIVREAMQRDLREVLEEGRS